MEYKNVPLYIRICKTVIPFLKKNHYHNTLIPIPAYETPGHRICFFKGLVNTPYEQSPFAHLPQLNWPIARSFPTGISAGGHAVAALPILTLLLLTHPAAPFSFTYNFTSPSDTQPLRIAFQGDVFYNKAIRLTRDERLGPITSSTSHAFYSRAVPLADPVSRRPASFVTAFAFSIAAPDPASASGDGLAFFLSLFPSVLPESSAGGLLGLFNSSSVRAGTLVAVEFDTYKND
jgi:hypothetical protein